MTTQTTAPAETPAAPAANTSASAPVASASAPASPAADTAALLARAEKAEKALAQVTKKIESGEHVKEHLTKLLGIGEKQDPTEVIRAKDTRITSLEANLKRALVRNAILEVVADSAHNPAHVVKLVGDDFDVDLERGEVAKDAIAARLAELRTSADYMFKKPAAAPAPVAAAPAPRGTPLPAPPPPPAANTPTEPQTRVWTTAVEAMRAPINALRGRQ